MTPSIITPAMRLVAFAQEAQSSKIAANVSVCGNHIHFYLYNTISSEPIQLLDFHNTEIFTHRQCDELISQANQQIEKVISNHEMTLRQGAAS